MAKRGKIEQELANRVKIVRALTRLKHAIAADNELNDTLDVVKTKFLKKVQQGRLPAAVNLDTLDKVFDV